MLTFEEIMETKIRKQVWPYRHVVLPALTQAPFGTDEYQEWQEKNWWMINYGVFMDDKPKAVALSRELEKVFLANPNDPQVQSIVEKLLELKYKDENEMTPLERWTKNAHQLAHYCSMVVVRSLIINALDKYSGSVLEAMCGHHSYFMESEDRVVTATDFCRESLLKHEFPERRRFCFDLDKLADGGHFPCFKEAEFDAISICFGFKYPKGIESVVAAFRRILKPGGTLSFVENPKSGYPELYERHFDQPGDITSVLLKAGYRDTNSTILQIPRTGWEGDCGEFYHIEGIK